ncbi:MAG: hypothetical protein L0Z50_07525, partial [Verrucomicrobiales bacterium]|nr:hypothetical protein [Verrucomicrobiales bacterium]
TRAAGRSAKIRAAIFKFFPKAADTLRRTLVSGLVNPNADDAEAGLEMLRQARLETEVNV